MTIELSPPIINCFDCIIFYYARKKLELLLLSNSFTLKILSSPFKQTDFFTLSGLKDLVSFNLFTI